MKLFLNAVALRGPGLDGWEASAPILAGKAPYLAAPTAIPPATLLPPNERRRAPQTVRLALAVGAEAFASANMAPADCPAVFASSGGDGETIHEILATLAGPVRELSPTRFHNSVHNVAAGYWSIATGAKTPATSLCAHDGSLAAGLLEAGAQALAGGTVALIAYDLPYPEPLASVRHIGAAFGVALLLSSASCARSLAQLEIELCAPGDYACTRPELEGLRRDIPAARILPLLEALARGEKTAVMLEYLEDLALAVRVLPFMNTLGREAILGLVPHAGAMCLLDSAQGWDATTISCTSSRYAQPDNPLRRADGMLGAACLIEIAAQAMALHGRLSAIDNAPPQPGFLVSLRDVMLHIAMLDGTEGPLAINARQILNDARGASYEFSISANTLVLAQGRAMVLFEVAL